MNARSLRSFLPRPAASDSAGRPLWRQALRLLFVWLALMLICAHLALVMADGGSRNCADSKPSRAPAARIPPAAGTAVSLPAEKLLEHLGKRLRESYAALIDACIGGRY